MDGRDAAPWASVPERLDRRMRLGPFPSGRDLLKFVTAAAAGTVVGLTVSPVAGGILATAGAVVALYQPGGTGLDRRAAVLLRWSIRRHEPGGGVSRDTAPPSGDAGVAELADGRRWAILRSGGVPLSFLPPTELATLFDRYRMLLRSAGSRIVLVACSGRFHSAPMDPAETAPPPEREALAGYRELVGLLGRRCWVRRVFVAVADDGRTVASAGQLETAVRLLSTRLAELGLTLERLHGPALGEAAARMGLGFER